MINVQEHNNQIFKKFYEGNKDSVIELPISEIHLKDKTHLNTYKLMNVDKMVHGIKTSKGSPTGTIIVNKSAQGYYVLVSGLRWFKITKLLNSSIKCIVVDSGLTHLKFNEAYGIIETSIKPPTETEKYINYKRLVILDKMKNRQPKKTKKEAKFSLFNDNKGILKTLEVRQRPDGKYALLDGYISYLWLKEQKERWIPVKVID